MSADKAAGEEFMAPPLKPSFVLVHGAWHGGWKWRRVGDALRQAGYVVFTPTLTGLGERKHLGRPETDLETHIADVMATIEYENLGDVVLCGHSYGGMVVTGVADRIPKGIRALVYADAFIPENGQSLFSILGAERAEKMRAGAREWGEGWKVKPLPASYYRVANPADAAHTDRMSTRHPIRCFEQPLELSGAGAKLNRVYIRAIGHIDGPFAPFTEKTRNQPGWTYYELPCGHDVMIDQPHALTGILLEVAARAAAA
jgi:pimeloyl-ACP methyl ester carboxylesterase